MSSFNAFMNRLFAPKEGQSGVAGERDGEDDERRGALNERELLTDETGRPMCLPRGKMPTVGDIRRQYQRAPSFASRLPWTEYLPESGCFLLEDGVSLGVVAEVTPAPSEGRSLEALEAVRDQIEAALQDSLPELDTHQWVVQLYTRDDTDPREDLNYIRDAIPAELQETEYTKAWLASMEAHFKAISRPDGLFEDDIITQTAWRGQTRRTRLVLYRWASQKNKSKLGERRSWLSPEALLNHVYGKLESKLASAGLPVRRYDGRDFHRWMMPRFNPRPTFSPDDPQRFYDLFDYPGDDPDARLWSYDLSEGMLASSPRADVESGLWYFDGEPQRVIPVEELRKVPKVGHLTAEISRGQTSIRNATFDVLPLGVEACMTIVAIPQEPLESHIDQLAKKAVGDSVLAGNVREDCQQARKFLGKDHKMYQSALAFFVSGRDEADLDRRVMDLTTQLSTADLKPVEPENEVAALNTYLRWLPMNFDPEIDRNNRWYTRFNFVQHLANLAPLYGRARGTGHPGISFFNRGGESLTFDPLNKLDRKQNAHMFVFGPTGAGKSATLNSMLGQVVAMRRPRLFIIEKGNSFGLLADYFERMGLSVNKVKLAPGANARLPPFAEAHRLLDPEMRERRVVRDRQDFGESPDDPAATPDDLLEAIGTDESDDDDVERDLLGEMEMMARLMITGGDPKEEADYRRADNRMVRDAVMIAAEKSFEEERQCLSEDVRQAFYTLSRDENLPDGRRDRAYMMGEGIGMFCDGFDGQVFNQPGEAWPECDVTIIDLAHYANPGYEAQLALSVMSITNMITTMAERDQYSGRPIIQVIDECHLLTANPLLAPFLVGVAKMGRKLNHWLWLATQNVKDFPDVSAKMLNMMEWWLLLNMPPNEIAEVSRFKTLTHDQRLLVESATKASGKYTEGVVLGGRLQSLFRVVPPSLYLSLAGTEPEEKAERAEIMREHGCSELDAAIKVAEKLDRLRGLETTSPSGEPAHG
jgi:conjugative transfer ATPase